LHRRQRDIGVIGPTWPFECAAAFTRSLVATMGMREEALGVLRGPGKRPPRRVGGLT
jgi:hypothetical protein